MFVLLLSLAAGRPLCPSLRSQSGGGSSTVPWGVGGGGAVGTSPDPRLAGDPSGQPLRGGGETGDRMQVTGVGSRHKKASVMLAEGQGESATGSPASGSGGAMRTALGERSVLEAGQLGAAPLTGPLRRPHLTPERPLRSPPPPLSRSAATSLGLCVFLVLSPSLTPTFFAVFSAFFWLSLLSLVSLSFSLCLLVNVCLSPFLSPSLPLSLSPVSLQVL